MSKAGNLKVLYVQNLFKWKNTPKDLARNTIDANMQWYDKSTEVPTLNRKYKTNDIILRYTRASNNVFIGNLFTSGKIGPSRRGYNSCQVIVV